MTAERLAELIDVGKRYVKYDDVPTLVHGLRHLFKRGRRGRLWAVRHVDLEINRGEAIGILGRNGSGKSTTLSMLAGVTAPTEGIVRVNGRIAPLLRLGIGFDQELTGRENVYVNGMILGQTSKEIDGRLDDIIAFSEIEDFIDTPVKFYSSGMTVRLGFASAVAADPDLLIIDEVLAVGDMAFQTKCFDRMLEMRANGATLVVVSHNMQSVQRLANEALVLRDGEVVFRGPTSDAISAYHESLRDARHVTEDADGETAAVEILSMDLHTEDGKLSSNVTSGETRCPDDARAVRFGHRRGDLRDRDHERGRGVRLRGELGRSGSPSVRAGHAHVDHHGADAVGERLVHGSGRGPLGEQREASGDECGEGLLRRRT